MQGIYATLNQRLAQLREAALAGPLHVPAGLAVSQVGNIL